jgi:hypothetical protein
MTGIMMSTRRRLATSSIVPNLVANTYIDDVFDPLDAECRLSFVNDGSLVFYASLLGSSTEIGQWLSGISSAQAALYELECVITAGSAFNGVGTTAAGAGIWRDLASTVTYANVRTTTGTKTTTATFRIRRKSDLAIMQTASIIITAGVSV